jgi:hypothetical protein
MLLPVLVLNNEQKHNPSICDWKLQIGKGILMLTLEFDLRSKDIQRYVLLVLPLALSAFTHLWNPIGFPSLYVDEGHYMRRAVQVLEGLGSQESPSGFNENRQYDHPYFGQLFLAAALQLVNYPDAVVTNPTGNVHSIEMLYMVPRLIMGVLAVIDTFLIYKICERRYNRNIAFIAAILFAVMPLSWFVRRILLESIQLPFLLLSILFAVSADHRKEKNAALQKHSNNYHTKRSLMVLLSGIFLGIAIFTKIPVFAIVPAIAFLIFINSNRSPKTLGLWFIPVLLIPLIWPAYSIFVGEFDEWMDGVKWQPSRFYRALYTSLEWDLKIDPVLFILGIVGIAFALIKRDIFPILWLLPFLPFLDYVGYAQFFHITPLIPIFCISGAILIQGLPRIIVQKYTAKNRGNKIKEKDTQTTLKDYVSNVISSRSTKPNYIKKVTRLLIQYLQFEIIAVIGIFGLVSTSMLATINLNSTYFMISSSIININNDAHDNEDDNNQVTVVGQRHWGIHYSWIPKYVFGQTFEFLPLKDIEALRGEKVLLILDKRLDNLIFSEANDSYIEKLRLVYNDTNTNSNYNDKHFHDRNVYPYTSLHQNRRVDIMELRTN